MVVKNILPLENSINCSKDKHSKIRGENHYTQFPERKKIAMEKRRNTRFIRRDEIFKANSKKKTEYDKKLADRIEKIEPYCLEYTINALQNDVYIKYLGKSKNYTMIKEDIKLYKSVMLYTEQYVNDYGGIYLPFSCRVQLIGKFRLNVPREYYCKCGIKLKFDRATQEFTYKGFCRKCMLTPTTEDFYKYKFEENWEYMFNIHKNKISETSRKLYSVLNGTNCCNIGRNEKIILDYMEKKHSITIDRKFNVIGYMPDGYCHDTNTIYEVYEPFHNKKSYKEKDLVRQKNIMNALKCKFVIIYDKTPKKTPDFENLKVEVYE